MKMSMKVTSGKQNMETFKQLREMPKNFKKGVRLGFEQAGASHEKTIKEDLNDKAAKTGRVYLKHLRGRLVRHKSSAPGQTAATFTGNYEEKLGTNITGGDTMQFGDNAEYARELELGDRDNLLPRPSLGNTVEKEQRNTQNYLGEQVFKAVSKK